MALNFLLASQFEYLITEIQMYCLHLKWVLDKLDQLDDDIRKEYERIQHNYDLEYTDEGDVCAKAVENILGNYTFFIPSTQRIGAICGYCLVIYHHLERFLEETLRLLTDKVVNNFKLEVFLAHYPQFKKSTHYERIEELRHVVNCIKHGSGASEKRLRTLRPDYFIEGRIDPECLYEGKLHPGKILKPLAGDDPLIKSEDFLKYVETINGFVREIGKELG